jgi:hypothetical protein
LDYTEPSDDTIDLEEFSHALLHEEGREMAVKLNESAFEHAKRLISEEKSKSMKETRGANISLPQRKRISLSAVTGTRNTPNGILELTKKNPIRPKKI